MQQQIRRPGRRKGDKPNPIDIHVGSRVRLRRNMLGLSQEKLGDAIGLTFQQVQKYERGANRIGASRLHELSRVLDVPVSFFFDDMDPVRAPAIPAGSPSRRPRRSTPIRCAGRETVELVSAYYRIDDAALRRRLLDLARALAAGRRAGETADEPPPRRARRRQNRLDARLGIDKIARRRRRAIRHDLARPACYSERRGDFRCASTISFLPANRCRKAIPTRFATAFRMRSSTRIFPPTRRRGAASRRWSRPIAWCSPAKPAARLDHRRTADRGGAPGDPRHRLRAGQFPLAARRRQLPHPQPVQRHRAGRGYVRQQGRGRRRPGHDVRFRLQRHAGADAGADLLLARDPARACPRRAMPAKRRSRSRSKSQVTLQYVAGKPVRRHQDRGLDPAFRPDRAARGARDRAARMCSTRCPTAGCATRSIFSSIRPAVS